MANLFLSIVFFVLFSGLLIAGLDLLSYIVEEVIDIFR